MKNADHHQNNSERPVLPAAGRNKACPGFYNMPKQADGRLCRIKLSGGAISLAQLRIIADLAEKYTKPQLGGAPSGIIELTTRGNLQLRGLADNAQAGLSAALTAAGLAPFTPQGDDIRNIMLNPTAGIAAADWGMPNGENASGRTAMRCAAQLSALCQQTPRYQKLSPKFSFYLDGGELCAVPDHKNDIWLSFLPKAAAQGEAQCLIGLASCLPRSAANIAADCLGLISARHAVAAFAALLDCFLAAAAADSALSRMKHWRAANGIDFIRAAAQAELSRAGLNLRPAKAENLSRFFTARAEAAQTSSGSKDTGFAMKAPALGAHESCFAGAAYLGIAPPLGRFSPRSLRRFCAIAAAALPANTHLSANAQQSLIFAPCPPEAAQRAARLFAEAGFISAAQTPAAAMLCCAGAPFCPAAKADTQADAAFLAEALAEIGLAGAELGIIHLSGCAKACAATSAKTFTLLALDKQLYAVYQAAAGADLAGALYSPRFGKLVAPRLTPAQIAPFLRRHCRSTAG